MQKLKAHIAADEWDEVNAYLNELEGDLDQVEIRFRTGNVSLDAILNSKLSMAERADIEINCKAELCEELSIPDIDLCVLVGNLIDNAVESCAALSGEKERFLRIYICVRRSQLYIAVTNATGETVRRPNHEYVTKKRGNHGHGLKRIDGIVEKYHPPWASPGRRWAPSSPGWWKSSSSWCLWASLSGRLSFAPKTCSSKSIPRLRKTL